MINIFACVVSISLPTDAVVVIVLANGCLLNCIDVYTHSRLFLLLLLPLCTLWRSQQAHTQAYMNVRKLISRNKYQTPLALRVESRLSKVMEV